MTELSLQQTVRRTDETNLCNLQEWCRHYLLNDKYPCDPKTRFGIAFYQIYQGYAWQDKENHAESLTAAAIHLLMVAENLELKIEFHLPGDLELLEYNQLDFRELLLTLSAAQQQIFYGSQIKKNVSTQRSSRFDKSKLERHMAYAIKLLIGAIEANYRKDGVENATRNMTGKL